MESEEDSLESFCPIKEGQKIWFKVQGNISIQKGDNDGWVSMRYRRHKLTVKKLKLSIAIGFILYKLYYIVYIAYLAQNRPGQMRYKSE